MNDELTQEKALLKYLNPRNEHKYSYNEKKQAYTQLKDIVEEYFKLMTLWKKIVENTKQGESVLGTLREALQQKPTVTRAEIETLKLTKALKAIKKELG